MCVCVVCVCVCLVMTVPCILIVPCATVCHVSCVCDNLALHAVFAAFVIPWAVAAALAEEVSQVIRIEALTSHLVCVCQCVCVSTQIISEFACG